MELERFERLYEEHAQTLYGFLAYRTGDPALAEDLLADAFERVLRSRRRFDPRKGSEKTWLYSVALNALRDHVRRAEVQRRALERVEAAATVGGDPGDAIEQVHEREALDHAMSALPADEREAVALRFAADMTLREIARVTGVGQKTAEGRVYRGLRKLREELGEP
jgi:RNA polymerase sigma factor (sigma-70 family)